MSRVVAPNTTTTATIGWAGAVPVLSGQQIGGTSQALTPPGISSPLRYGSTQKAKPAPPGPSPSPAMAHPTVRITPRLIPVPWYTARLIVLPMHPSLSLPPGPGRLGSTSEALQSLISPGAGTAVSPHGL